MNSSPKVLLTGSSGFVGSALKPFLESQGFAVVCLKRSKSVVDNTSSTLFWDPHAKKWHLPDFEGFEAVIHLAGEGIVSKYWTAKRKEQLRKSRIDVTEALVELLSQLESPPHLLLCASAVGYYGSCGSEILTEKSPLGEGFLAQMCHDWEMASSRLEKVRVIHARFGIVMGKGGFLAKLIPLFKWCLGGKLGSGKQYISWIALEDLIRAILFCIHKSELKGAINFVSQEPTTQAELTKELADQLDRPAFCHMPAFLLRLIFQEMAEEMLLTSQYALPERLIKEGFTFSCPHLKEAVKSAY